MVGTSNQSDPEMAIHVNLYWVVDITRLFGSECEILGVLA